jgi:pilus assembly protein TadC
MGNVLLIVGGLLFLVAAGAMIKLMMPSQRRILRNTAIVEDEPVVIQKPSKYSFKAAKKAPLTFEERMFQAGIITPQQIKDFKRLQILCPIGVGIVVTLLMLQINDPVLMIAGIVIGVLAGMRIPSFIIDKRIKHRDQEIMYYLPLVIEQIGIGVSSSLDTGPCIRLVVQMADERDSHNVVTELLKLVTHYTRQGVSMEEALTEVGKRAGHTELKHAFMSLAQVSKHGGEVTRQLQELANSVSLQREAKIEGIIKTLELKATPPVALVFFAFMILLMFMFGSQLMQGLGSM